MAETRFPDFTNGEMKLGDERQVFAKSVVDAAIQVYVNGRVNDYLPVRLMGQWLRGVDRLLPDSTLSWPDRHRLIAELLYLSGMRLGGLPIKAMQFVGLRDDLPDGYQQWFSKAQEDNKLRSPADHVQKTLAVFGPNLTWSYEPLKSASIAQVHLDVTWERRAAVAKVQHPHVKDQYLADLDTMKYLGEYVNHHDEAKGAAVMLGALAEKLRPTVVAETDFTKEAENQRKLREFLQGIATVPEVFAATTTALVMERVNGMTAAQVTQAWKDGEKLDHFGPRQRRNLYSIYARMVSGGRFQADPHPGNIMSPNEGADAIGLLDFGQCCEVTPQQKNLFHAFAVGAPTSEFEANNQERNLEWLKSLGIEVHTPEQAQATANLLFFGQKSPMFPDTKAIDPELTPLLLLVLYLSRFENKVVELRKAVGFEDEANSFAVLMAFRKQIAANL